MIDLKNKKVLVGMPSGSGVVPISMVQSLLQLVKPLPCGFAAIERTRVDRARNAIVKQALSGGFDYLFFVDDDNPVPPETLQVFLNDDKDIVIAPILTRNLDENGNRNVCAFYSKEVKAGETTVRVYEPIKEFRDNGPLHRIDGGGCGAMLIKRKVLEVLYPKYEGNPFEFGDIRFPLVQVNGKDFKRRTMSEDMEFCERAVDAGFEVWLDERIRPTHLTGSRSVQWTG